MRNSRFVTVLVAAVVVIIAAGVGQLLYKEAKARRDARALVTIVGETTGYLKGAVKAVPPQALENVESGLRSVKSWRDRDAAEAAEQYLIDAREILRRRADANRLKQKAAASREALHSHMAQAGSRTLPWIRAATDLKKQVERDYFDLNMQLSALADLWSALPQSTKRLAPHVEASLILEEAERRSALRAVLDEARRHQAELERSRDLLSPR
jgi:hypothetical protein